jgi:hypothetical protein
VGQPVFKGWASPRQKTDQKRYYAKHKKDILDWFREYYKANRGMIRETAAQGVSEQKRKPPDLD